jgi:hypothetical protein
MIENGSDLNRQRLVRPMEPIPALLGTLSKVSFWISSPLNTSQSDFYPTVPQTAAANRMMRTLGQNSKPIFHAFASHSRFCFYPFSGLPQPARCGLACFQS